MTGRTTKLLLLFAGSMDSLTGLLLITAPELTAGLMRVQTTPQPIVFLQWIGVFVLGIGSSYFYPLLRDAGQTRTVLLLTAWPRLLVALFVGQAVLTGRLDPAWSGVALVDGLLALIQGRLCLGRSA